MSPEAQAPVEPRVTIDDLKHRAEAVKSLAVRETKDAVNTVFDENATRTLIIVAGVVVVVASLAFFLGSKSVRSSGGLPVE